MIGFTFSIFASADVVASSQFVAKGETVCVRVASTGPSSVSATGAAATGAVVFVPPALALGPLQLVDELLDCGCERRVGGGYLADGLEQALNGVVFCRGLHGQGVK